MNPSCLAFFLPVPIRPARPVGLLVLIALYLVLPSAHGFPWPAPAPPTRGLVIADKVVTETPETYQQVIKFLTIPTPKRDDPAFKGTDIAKIKALESPLRRQIFEAMKDNPAELFEFSNLQAAEENVTMRLSMIRLMIDVCKGRANGGADVDYHGRAGAPTANPYFWVPAERGSFYFSTRRGVRPSEAVDGAFKRPYRTDCLGCVQMIMYHGALEAIGAKRFDELHPDGLEIRLGSDSFSKHYWTADKIDTRNMVPGDWVYMKNKADYDTDRTPYPAATYWRGEHALYMGKYDEWENWTPLWLTTGGAQRFSGLGVYNRTEAGVRERLRQGYLDLMRPPFTYYYHTVSDSDIRWERHSFPDTGS